MADCHDVCTHLIGDGVTRRGHHQPKVECAAFIDVRDKMKKKIVAAFKNQIVAIFIVSGAIIIATTIFIFTIIRLVCVEGTRAFRSLVRPKLDAFRQTDKQPK